MLSINTNLSSLIAQNSLTTSTNKLNQAIERMTTGFKINHAKDNAANYSISTNMSTKIGAYDIAADNVAMGMDLVTTASDTISLMQDYGSRLQALCTQARNGTYGQQSIDAINSEAAAIMAEINRLYSTAEYNKVSLFNNKAYELSAGHKALLETVCAKPEYNGFIEDPETYTDAEVAAMTALTDDITTLTSGQKYSISTVDELVNLAELVNSGVDTTGVEFVLGSDINLSSISNWTPIGDYSTSSSYQFKGTFDGNGHIIKNLTINNESKNYQGLFGCVRDSSSTIKNLGLKNVNIKGNNYVGGVIGDGGYSSITNSFVTGHISGGEYVGGVTGLIYGFNNRLANLYANVDIVGETHVGGIAGSIGGGPTMDLSVFNCYSKGKVKGENNIGGLFGYVTQRVNITKCYSESNVVGNGTGFVGGLVGNMQGGINNSSFLGAVSGTGKIGSLFGVYTGAACAGMALLSQPFGYRAAGISIDPNEIQEFSALSTSTTLQVGINSNESCQLSFDTNFSYNLSDIETDISSDEALAQITEFINLLSEKSTQLGAIENRLDSALDSIEVNLENLTSSLSTIRDADIAEVSSEYIRQQILQQASATLMSTANQSPSIALQLI